MATEQSDPDCRGLRRHHRLLRRRQVHRHGRFEDAGLLLRGQPAARDDRRSWWSCSSTRARRSSGRPWSATCAAAPTSRRWWMLDEPPGGRPAAPDAVPRGRRGRAGGPLQGDPPAPPAGAGESGRSAAIEAERELLDPMRERADVSSTPRTSRPPTAQVVADKMLPRGGRSAAGGHLHLVRLQARRAARRRPALDVRFLPNPHYEAELRPLTGRDERVREYVARDGIGDVLRAT